MYTKESNASKLDNSGEAHNQTEWNEHRTDDRFGPFIRDDVSI